MRPDHSSYLTSNSPTRNRTFGFNSQHKVNQLRSVFLLHVFPPSFFHDQYLRSHDPKVHLTELDERIWGSYKDHMAKHERTKWSNNLMDFTEDFTHRYLQLASLSLLYCSQRGNQSILVGCLKPPSKPVVLKRVLQSGVPIRRITASMFPLDVSTGVSATNDCPLCRHQPSDGHHSQGIRKTLLCMFICSCMNRVQVIPKLPRLFTLMVSGTQNRNSKT